MLSWNARNGGCKARRCYIRHRMVPSIRFVPQSLRTSFISTDETGQSSVGATPARSGFHVGGIAILPGPGNLDDWLGFDRDRLEEPRERVEPRSTKPHWNGYIYF